VSKKKSKRGAPKWKGPWRIHFFKRHKEDDSAQSVPGREFLDACPTSVRAKLVAIITAVADAPPPMFSGGGKWEAMHGNMSGFFEARTDGESREHFRLFCVLARDGAGVGLGGPSLVIITGMRKGFKTTFTNNDYEQVRALGLEYFKRIPRSVA
jgi:hypothetical protein